MKILMISFPYSGHTIPTLPVIRQLVLNGHDVTVINHKKWREKTEELGAKFIPCDNYIEKILYFDIKDVYAYKALYNTALQLKEKFDLLMYEFMFFQGNFLAKQLNIPAVRFCSSHAYSDKVIQDFFNNSKLWKIINFPLFTKLGTIILNKGIPYKVNNYIEAMSNDYPDLNIVFTCKDFQLYGEDFCDEKFKFIGTSINNNTEIIDTNFINWSKIKTPIIYISMGTLMEGTYNFLKKCIKAFENKNITVIISSGTAYKKIKKINTANNILIFDYVPQLEVLKHADLFITHGGMNSINEAMFIGTPMFVVPVAFDQCSNAQLVNKHKIGLNGLLNKITTNEIYEKSIYILSNKEIQKNVQEWQQKQRYAGGVTKAVEEIEKYVNYHTP